MIDPEQLSTVIGQFYEAALDPDGWPVALEGVAAFVGGAAAMLFWQDSLLAKRGRYHSWGDDPEFTRSYFEKYIALSPVRKIQYLIPVGNVTSISRIIGIRNMRQTQFFREWMHPQGYVDNVLTNLDRTSTSLAAFAVARHERDGVVDAAARRKMALLAPHVRRAVLIGKLVDLRRSELRPGRACWMVSAPVYFLSIVAVTSFRRTTLPRRRRRRGRDRAGRRTAASPGPAAGEGF